MKKYNIAVLLFTAFLLASCSNGSSGTRMLNLGEVRVVPVEKSESAQAVASLFTVAPGPYEFVWEEMKNRDTAAGYEQCITRLKLKLVKSNNKKLVFGYAKDTKPGESPKYFNLMFNFKALDAEGNDMFVGGLQPQLANINEDDGKIGPKENVDGLIDFYRFLTGESGNEHELVLDCGVQSCKKIEDILEKTKGLVVEIEDMSFTKVVDM